VSETVDSLGERLAARDEDFTDRECHLIGQLAAELIASASEQELSQAIVMIKELRRDTDPEDLRRDSDPEGALSVRQSLLSTMSGLLQSVLGDRQSPGRLGVPLDVRERVLNLLVIAPQNPTELSNAIGCSPAITSRSLTGLHDAGLVEPRSDSEGADEEFPVYELTTKGEQRQDDRFFGRLADGPEIPKYDYGEVLQSLTGVVAELNTHDPAIAEVLYPGLAVLNDQVYDPQLRAAAVNELGGPYGGNPVG
jgi:Bacterial regulatory protein, arsR family